MCGVMATVEDGRITKIRPNPDHVHSKGHFCRKATAMVDVTYDPDRILHPLKRDGGPGEFKRISWDQVYSEICSELKKVRLESGPEAVATYVGNPPYYGYATMLALQGFQQTMGVKWKYGVNGEDGNALIAADTILYGSAGLMPKPDLWRTDFLIIAGANPLVSHGSAMSEPLVAQALNSIVRRGGRIVVVDPRRTETASKYEHLPIFAGADGYLVTALIREVIAQGVVDGRFVARRCNDFDELNEAVRDCTPEWASEHCGIPADAIRSLAVDFAAANSATVHCRTGTSTQRFGTLSTMGFQVLCAITGNLDAPGGLAFGGGIVDMSKIAGTERIGVTRSRASGLPEVGGSLPSSALVGDILEAGSGQVRALIMLGANPCLSSPACGPELDAALQALSLFVSLDLYINETNRYANYILPATSMFEREDLPLLTMAMQLRPSLYATGAVVEPRGEAKEDWVILDEVCRKLGLGGALGTPLFRRFSKLGVRVSPRQLIDMLIRTSAVGDKFGLKPNGLSFSKLVKRHPNGVALSDDLPSDTLGKKLATPDRRICLASQEFLSEVERLKQDTFYRKPDFPMRMISMREKISHNTWMHNARSVMPATRRHLARMNPSDAAARQIMEGELISIVSADGEISTHATLTDTLTEGTIAVPQGWGHNAGWRYANQKGGVNSNLIASGNPADFDKVSGISTLNGIPVQVRKADSEGVAASAESTATIAERQ